MSDIDEQIMAAMDRIPRGPTPYMQACSELAAYTAAVRRMALEEAACMLDREHKARKHLDNHAAYHARMIRELAIHIPPTCTDFCEK